jgi:DNA-binding transcriptional LysR family regulator
VDQLDGMRVFATIAERGSLSAAARTLGVPLASVSRKLAALETQLGARLVSRSTRRMAITEAGARYLAAVRRVLGEVEAANRSVAGDAAELEGRLAITAPIVFGRVYVLPIIIEFLQRHPRVDVRLALADHNFALIEEGIDAAVRIGTLPDSSLTRVRVGTMRRIACASPAYLKERGSPAQPDDLAAHDCVSFSGLSSPERWAFPDKRGTRSVAVRSRLVVNTAEAAVDAAIAGLGITRLLAYQVAGALADGRLVCVLERFEPPAAPVSIVHGEGRTPRPKLRELIALAAERLRAALREVA